MRRREAQAIGAGGTSLIELSVRVIYRELAFGRLCTGATNASDRKENPATLASVVVQSIKHVSTTRNTWKLHLISSIVMCP